MLPELVDRPLVIAGLEHVISSGGGAWEAAGSAWSLDTAAGVVIGEVDGPDEYVFGQISGVVVDAARRIHVADPQTKRITVFSAEGRFLQHVGRNGEGPGEFRHVSGLAEAPGGFAALDPILRRVTVFGPAGRVVRTFMLARSRMTLEDYAPMAFDSSGWFFDRARLSRLPDTDSVGVVVYDTAGAVADTVLLAVIPIERLTIQGSFSVPRPFAPLPSFAFGSRGLSIWRGEASTELTSSRRPAIPSASSDVPSRMCWSPAPSATRS